MYSTETLFHFTCGKCNLWFSIAITAKHSCAEEFAMEKRELYCPWCGNKEKHKKKEVPE